MRNENGLTLIEVLVALAILSIALTSVIYSASRTIRHMTYLTERTLATMVGLEIINEIQANLRKIAVGENVSGEMKMGNQAWHFNAAMTTTPNPVIRKIMLQVSPQQDENKILAKLDGFYYVKK